MGKRRNGKTAERQTYTLEEYMDLLGRSRITVVKKMQKGLIPGFKDPGDQMWTILKPEVDLYLRGEWKPKVQNEEAA